MLPPRLWYRFIEQRRSLFTSCYVLIAIHSVWSNNEEHSIHDIRTFLPSLSLAHATNILSIHQDVVGKSNLQRPIQVGLTWIQKNGMCHVTFSRIPCWKGKELDVATNVNYGVTSFSSWSTSIRLYVIPKYTLWELEGPRGLLPNELKCQIWNYFGLDCCPRY